MLGIQFALYFSHLWDLDLGCVFINVGLVAIRGDISYRTIIETLRSFYTNPALLSPNSPAYFEATNQPHYFHQNVR